EGAEEINQYAFSGCESLQSIILPSTLLKIGTRAFDNCVNLAKVSFSNAGSGNAKWVCAYCSKENQPGDRYCVSCGRAADAVPMSVKWVCAHCRKENQAGDRYCVNCGYVNSRLEIHEYAFPGCTSLKQIQLDADKIGNYAFSGCGAIVHVVLNANSVGDNAFQGCTGIIEAKLTIIEDLGNQAFAQCSSLKNLHVSAARIGNQAFQGCTALESVAIQTKEIGNYAFSGCGALPEISTNAGKIGKHAFENCGGLKKIALENPGARIEDDILYGCSLNQLTVSVEKIPDNCFRGVNVRNVIMTPSVKEIGESSFEGCSGLVSLVMPSTITSIGNTAFKDCIRLETIMDETNRTISIPRSARKLGRRIFQGCESLKKISIYAPDIGEEAFSGMPSLEAFTVSSDVKIIRKHAFEDCVKLRSVDLKDKNEGSASVEMIEDEAFKGCVSLEKFRLPATLKSLGRRIFLGCSDSILIVYGASEVEWRKVNGSNAGYKEWTGLKVSRDMKNYCMGKTGYAEWNKK
ncbi:MAG: leucine-rich repeat protein, partial [Clostridia bacterium]|nr:leucine-rich repeat protein [Clostridia bacterium]